MKGINRDMAKKFLDKEKRVGKMLALLTGLFFLVYMPGIILRAVCFKIFCIRVLFIKMKFIWIWISGWWNIFLFVRLSQTLESRNQVPHYFPIGWMVLWELLIPWCFSTSRKSIVVKFSSYLNPSWCP